MQRDLHLAVVFMLVAPACATPSSPSPATTSEPALIPSVTAAVASPPSADVSAAPTPAPAEVVREEVVVDVDGQKERWKLVWTSPPAPDCVDEGWRSCACFDRELGERGPLALVRARPDGTEQRLALGTITLPRWRVEPDDARRFPGKVDLAAVSGRPLVQVMKLGDYDHDGRATELVLERGNDVCGFHRAIVAGVSRRRDELHVFATAGAPEVELDLPRAADWEKLRRALPGELVYIPCGFKGGWPTFEVIHVSRDAAGLHARHRRYACSWVEGIPTRGKRIFDRPWTGIVDDG
jgi:hypothetical protein